jgi:hypothetical protein
MYFKSLVKGSGRRSFPMHPIREKFRGQVLLEKFMMISINWKGYLDHHR